MNFFAQQRQKISRSTHPATRAILKAMGVFGGVRALSIFCSLVRNKLIAVWIGPIGVGLLAIFNSVIELIGTTTRLNIDQSAIRDIAAKNGKDATSTIIAVKRWSIILGILGSLFLCLMSPLLSLWSFDTTDRWWAFCILSLLPLCYSYTGAMQSILQGQRNFAAFARVGVITALVGIVISVPIIYFLREDSIIWVILSYGFALLVGVMFNMPKVPHAHQSLKETWAIGSSFIRLGFMLTLASLMTQLFNYLFILYIKNYSSTEQLGLFQASYTVINNYVGILFTGIWIEYFPRLSAMAHSPRRLSTSVTHQIATTVWILIPIIALFIGADRLVVTILYNNTFIDMLPLLTVGIISVIPRYVSWCMAYTILAKGDGKIYMLSETVSGVIGLILNVVAYSTYGFVGLGVSYIIWYLIYILIINTILRRRYNIHITSHVFTLMWIAIAFGFIAIAAKITLGWCIPIILGIAALPLTYRRILK